VDGTISTSTSSAHAVRRDDLSRLGRLSAFLFTCIRSPGRKEKNMLPKSVICCLAATIFVATTALMPTGASAGGRGGGGGKRAATRDLELAALC
jgi:hypothetical protein